MARFFPVVALTVALLISCGGGKGAASAPAVPPASTAPVQTVTVPAFNADSAYSYVKAQVDFGPRVPNTAAHKACAMWLADKLRGFGAETVVQDIEVTTFDGTVIKGFNIIGQYRPELRRRVIICSHWDSRPWADNDPDKANRRKPVDAANDGASGVGVILEIARQMQKQQPQIGVDCIFFDAEDWGPGPDWHGNESADMWGLGTQYWSRRKHKADYNARFAILLDMVGGEAPTFYREAYSNRYAKDVVDKVWGAARETGNGRLFVDEVYGYVTDDHVFINTIAKIPAVDVIPSYPDCKESTFGPTWHTVSDNMDHIDRQTLLSVGQTIMYVIYNEK